MVFIVLGAFALGCAFGVLAMVPSWWKHRRVAQPHAPSRDHPSWPQRTAPPPNAHPNRLPPPRDGL
jgi:hypothetical protein